MNSKVLTIAHKVKADFNTWSEAVQFSWTKVKLQRCLKEGDVKFIFKKKSTGENRLSNGTLKLDTEYIPTKPKKPNYLIQKFFDIDKQGWRSLDVRTLIKVY